MRFENESVMIRQKNTNFFKIVSKITEIISMKLDLQVLINPNLKIFFLLIVSTIYLKWLVEAKERSSSASDHQE